MEIVLIEPVYAGPVSYFQSLLRAEQVIWDVHAHYQKRSYRNRCVILGSHGRLALSIPLVHGKGLKQALKDVRISYAENWQKDHWMSLTSAYRRAPFFEFYEDLFRPFYEQRTTFLSEFNIRYFDAVCSALKLSVNDQLSENYVERESFSGKDLRDMFQPQHMHDVKPYLQVFADRMDFVSDLSVLDVVFNLGPAAKAYLEDQI